MEKTIVIGDLHGLTYWKDIVKNHPSCRYVFLGDYADPYEYIPNEKVMKNLSDVIAFKESRMDQVVLLLGNHDMHYITSDCEIGSRFNVELATDLAELFIGKFHLFQYAYQEDNCVFTHAGISQKWFVEDFKGNRDKNIAEQLNNPLSEEQITALFRCGACRGGQKDKTGGIFWADIRELFEPLEGFTQIVGHNRVEDIYDHCNKGGRIIFCDSLFNHHYLQI